MMQSRFRSVIFNGIPLWILILGHIFSVLFLRDLGRGLNQIDDIHVVGFARLVHSMHLWVTTWVAPPAIALIVLLQIQLIRRVPVQWGIDILGVLLTVRCALLFVILNLLLLSHLRAGGMLLMQLVLFIPVITINFGWLYWRLDSAARLRGHSHIRFSEQVGELDPYDYFHVAAMTLLQFAPSGASPTSRLMKALFVLHGVMMLDLVALALSRAIALASGG